MQQQELIPHLFRTEFRKIASVLCEFLGIERIEVAEDITSETFLQALETWSYKGIPENPTAWLYTVAKNKARNYMVRNKIFTKKVADEIRELNAKLEIDLSDKNIMDSQLQMLFAICHPSISTKAQVSLALRILCGFGIEEIATAFFTNKETINKRLFRAKEKLRLEKVDIAFPPESEVDKRLDTVLTTLYLLYNEGYYSESQDDVLREDLCAEAMRLTYQLLENERTDLPAVNALFALMSFQSSRFAARRKQAGEFILYHDQDETLWNHELIAKGTYYLNRASTGTRISKYHLEAAIAYWHTIKANSTEKWSNILKLYDHLLELEYSTLAALNRIYALSKVKGEANAIAEAEKLTLTNNHFYYTLLGELYRNVNTIKAKENFEKALALARTNTDKQTISRKLNVQ
ncbi:RNA polymerase sigma factor [Chryseosolibacter indicus]|uniref:Sigma-70 family RNA polymerase sigma factor n=1 Tax=Chryseosolibacter indicus TaxID=2782351 RepID=A0ABS5VLE7_9BACT|nr:sigma-70 family RNA polymerase sigma factor [Chryseosolibacter indicus]MBT1702201.1 sigma-70 family RNA polymerase sigma factor [Chryseosolibacter indicus]